jgi:hypothetical protein
MGVGCPVSLNSDKDSTPQGALDYFFDREAALYDYFSKELTPRERLTVLVYEMLLPLWYFFGYLLALLFLRFFTVQALAQPSSVPSFLGMSQDDWRLAMHVCEFGVILLAFVACCVHIITSKRANQWVWRTATFLLGFMTKSLSSFI